MVRDGLHDVPGGDGLGERHGQLAHPDRPLGPGRRSKAWLRAGQAFQARSGPCRYRTEKGSLLVIRLGGPCREHGQHPDRPIGTREGQCRRAGCPDPQTVPTHPDVATTPHGARGRHVLHGTKIRPRLGGLREKPAGRRQTQATGSGIAPVHEGAQAAEARRRLLENQRQRLRAPLPFVRGPHNAELLRLRLLGVALGPNIPGRHLTSWHKRDNVESHHLCTSTLAFTAIRGTSGVRDTPPLRVRPLATRPGEAGRVHRHPGI